MDGTAGPGHRVVDVSVASAVDETFRHVNSAGVAEEAVAETAEIETEVVVEAAVDVVVDTRELMIIECEWMGSDFGVTFSINEYWIGLNVDNVLVGRRIILETGTRNYKIVI